MARKPTLKNSAAHQLFLDGPKLDMLKHLSSNAFASAVYGAAINRDDESMEEVLRYLGSIQNYKPNAEGVDGKSMMNREYAVAAYKHKDGEAPQEIKSRAYIFPLLLAPLRGMSKDPLSHNGAEEYYLASVISLANVLKVESKPLAAAVNYLCTAPEEAPFKGVVDHLIDKMTTSEPLMGVLYSTVSSARHAKDIDESFKDTLLERARYIVQSALGSGTFCNGFVADCQAAIQKGVNNPFIQPWFEALTEHMDGGQWPKHVAMREMLQDGLAVRAMHDLSQTRLLKRKGFEDLAVATNYPDPLLLDDVTMISATEYLQKYSQIAAAVPAFVSRSAQIEINTASNKQAPWQSIEPIQHRINAHGGVPVWPAMVEPFYKGEIEPIKQIIQAHGPHSSDACTTALNNLGQTALSYKVGSPKTELAPMIAFAPMLLALGAHPNKESEDGHWTRGFIHSLESSPMQRHQLSILSDMPEVSQALQASLARLRVEETAAVPQPKKRATQP